MMTVPSSKAPQNPGEENSAGGESSFIGANIIKRSPLIYLTLIFSFS
jgi:hypothetical protein